MNLVERFLSKEPSYRIFAVFGFIAPLITFLIALADMPATFKIILLAMVAVSYVVIFVFASRNRVVIAGNTEQNEFSRSFVGDLPDADKFSLLDEANQFFDAALNQRDMFRIVASKVNEVFPFAAAAFLVPDPENDKLNVVETIGDIPDDMFSRNIEIGLAGMAFVSGEIELDILGRTNGNADFVTETSDFASAAAIPLVYEGRIMAIFEMFTDAEISDRDRAIETLRGLQSRITPLFLGSFALERNLTSAFTDALTELPNERAFYMVLENQLAESIRFRGDRPLTVLSVDVRNFRLINDQFGHSTGDKVLIEVTERIRIQLRKMDFLARTNADEFLVALPLADGKAAADVISRILTYVSANDILVGELEIPVELNFGIATYWEDGETPQQLVKHAQLRKQQMKAEESGNVVSFQKEYVN